MKNVVIVEAVHTHTHTHTCNLIKEKINALLYALKNDVNINVAHTDKYKIDEFLI